MNDELASNLLDITQETATTLTFVATSKNKVTIKPGFKFVSSVWTSKLLVSDGVNTPV